MKITDLITVDKDILGGRLYLKIRVFPVQSLFWHIENDITVDKFFEDFPSVSKIQVTQLLELSGQIFTSSRSYRTLESAA